MHTFMRSYFPKDDLRTWHWHRNIWFGFIRVDSNSPPTGSLRCPDQANPSATLMQASHCADVDPQWIHTYIFLAATSGIVWHAKDLAMGPDAGETQPS